MWCDAYKSILLHMHMIANSDDWWIHVYCACRGADFLDFLAFCPLPSPFYTINMQQVRQHFDQVIDVTAVQCSSFFFTPAGFEKAVVETGSIICSTSAHWLVFSGNSTEKVSFFGKLFWLFVVFWFGFVQSTQVFSLSLVVGGGLSCFT